MESYIVTIALVAGKRDVKRRDLHIPLDACTGNYERLSDLAIRDLQKDLAHEITRRKAALANRAAIQQQTGGWSPFDALRGAA